MAVVASGFVAKKPAARRSSGGGLSPKFVSKAATVSAVKLVSGILLIASAAEISVVVGVKLTLRDAEVLVDGLAVRDDEGVTVRVAEGLTLMVGVALALILALILVLTLALADELVEGETELLEVWVAVGLVLRPEVGLTVLAGL